MSIMRASGGGCSRCGGQLTLEDLNTSLTAAQVLTPPETRRPVYTYRYTTVFFRVVHILISRMVLVYIHFFLFLAYTDSG